MNPKTARKLFDLFIIVLYLILAVFVIRSVSSIWTSRDISSIVFEFPMLFPISFLYLAIIFSVTTVAKDQILYARNMCMAIATMEIFLIFPILRLESPTIWVLIGPLPWTILTFLAHLSIEPKKPNLKPPSSSMESP
jgi:ABC-type multidrug transport system permease subunit